MSQKLENYTSRNSIRVRMPLKMHTCVCVCVYVFMPTHIYSMPFPASEQKTRKESLDNHGLSEDCKYTGLPPNRCRPSWEPKLRRTRRRSDLKFLRTSTWDWRHGGGEAEGKYVDISYIALRFVFAACYALLPPSALCPPVRPSAPA